MSAGELIGAIVAFAASLLFLILGISHFAEKGFLLNNAYIYASKKERETMDKKPYYRQTAVVFCILSAVFIVVGLALVVNDDKLLLAEIPLILAAVIYAVISSVRINKQK